MRTASIHPEGLFEWDQNDKTRKNEMRVGDYIFVAIFDDEQLADDVEAHARRDRSQPLGVKA